MTTTTMISENAAENQNQYYEDQKTQDQLLEDADDDFFGFGQGNGDEAQDEEVKQAASAFGT